MNIKTIKTPAQPPEPRTTHSAKLDDREITLELDVQFHMLMIRGETTIVTLCVGYNREGSLACLEPVLREKCQEFLDACAVLEVK